MVADPTGVRCRLVVVSTGVIEQRLTAESVCRDGAEPHIPSRGAPLACGQPARVGSLRGMTSFSVTEIGPMDSWRDHFGGFVPQTTRDGRRVVDDELDSEIIGFTATAYEPGEEAGYWHSHSVLEEVYIFLEGTGQMGLDDTVVNVGPGTVVHVPTGVMRTWRCLSDSPTQLKWLCIRAGQIPLPAIPDDATPITDIPMPW